MIHRSRALPLHRNRAYKPGAQKPLPKLLLPARVDSSPEGPSPRCAQTACTKIAPRPFCQRNSPKGSLFPPTRGPHVTDAFTRGAELTLAAAQAAGTKVAVLKEGSPSCSSRIADGSFSGAHIPGADVTTTLLHAHGITVLNGDQLKATDAPSAADSATRMGERQDHGRSDKGARSEGVDLST